MNKTQIEIITEKAERVMKKYQEEYPNVKMDRDYVPFKISEEWGECLQAYLMLTDRARQKDKNKEEIKELFSEEIADVFAYLLIFAKTEGIDLEKAVSKKWFKYLE